MSGVSTSPPFSLSSLQSKNKTTIYGYGVSSANTSKSPLSDTKLKKRLLLKFGTPTRESDSISLKCNSSTGPGGPGSGDNESRSVLDAFFLGKALAEAVNERIESAVGEFLSTIGRLQAEQQKQIQEFQEDVSERAKKAKENAAREALAAQGLVPKPTTVDTTSVTYGVDSATSSPTTNAVTPTNSSTPNSSDVPIAQIGTDPSKKGPAFGFSDDD